MVPCKVTWEECPDMSSVSSGMGPTNEPGFLLREFTGSELFLGMHSGSPGSFVGSSGG
jgi:hypothetical protein